MDTSKKSARETEKMNNKKKQKNLPNAQTSDLLLNFV